MIFSFSLGGHGVPVIKEFKTDKSSVLKKGRAAYLGEDGLVNGEGNGSFIGVFAEEHSGKNDILNARADGDRVRVDITSGGVYKMTLPMYEATSDGTETTVCFDSSAISENMTGELMMIYKSLNSVNSDGVGTRRKITGVTVSGKTATVTAEAGGKSCKGDRYAFIPKIGSLGGIDANKCGFSPAATGSSPSLKVVSCDEKALTLEAAVSGGFFN